jgi:hypothetical protein
MQRIFFNYLVLVEVVVVVVDVVVEVTTTPTIPFVFDLPGHAANSHFGPTRPT